MRFPNSGGGALFYLQVFHFDFSSAIASSFTCYRFFIFISFKVILEVLDFAMLNHIWSCRSAAFCRSEILRKSSCSREILHVIRKMSSIRISEKSNAQHVQIILLFDCSNITIKDLYSALPSHIASHWHGNNSKQSNDPPPVITELCQSQRFEMTICIPNQQLFKRHNSNQRRKSKRA